MLVALIVIVVLIVVVAVLAIGTYNGLVRLRTNVESAWAQIEVQLNRRHDLIPNLVATVKASAAHEAGTLEKVIEARNRATAANNPADRAAAEQAVSGALANVFALAEAYPDLKANQSFVTLQGQLSETEDRVAYARQYYNDTVDGYNAKTQAFPGVLIAGPAGFKPREYFRAPDDTRGPVQVDFQ